MLFRKQIKQQLSIGPLSDQTRNHLALQTLGRWRTEALDTEMYQGFRTDTFCVELTSTYHPLMVSTVYPTWPGIPRGFRNDTIKDLSAYFKREKKKTEPLSQHRGKDLLTAAVVTLVTVARQKYLCGTHKFLALQIPREYADVSRCSMQMRD